MKLIDVDQLFEKYLRNIMTKNVGKYSEDEWESKMPELYQKFGDAPLLELDGQSPKSYFQGLSGKDVVQTLVSYVEQGVAVPDYLCDAITANKDAEESLLSLIDPETEEELLSYAINLLEERGSEKAISAYFEGLFSNNYSDDVKELMTEILAEHASLCASKALQKYAKASEKVKGYLLDILVNGEKNDKVFDVLLQAFLSHAEDTPLYTQYLVKYGDDRALPHLLKRIANPDINYVDFQELRNAIEVLGGEYDAKRDFSEDRFYKAIQRAQEKGEENPS